MKYYLENKTFGFSPDACLFNSFEEALDALYECVRIDSQEENERCLRITHWYNGKSEFSEHWTITEVFDWDSRQFGMETNVIIERSHGSVFAIDGTFGEVFAEYHFA